MHGEPATLHLEDLWIKNVTITTGLVDTVLDADAAAAARRPASSTPARFVTHRFALDEFMEAYDVFARAGDTGALKVVLTRPQSRTSAAHSSNITGRPTASMATSGARAAVSSRPAGLRELLTVMSAPNSLWSRESATCPPPDVGGADGLAPIHHQQPE